MLKAFVLAAGKGERWGWDSESRGLKQLVEIEGEKLLARTIRQLKERRVDPVIVVGEREELEAETYACDAVWLPSVASKCRWVVETWMYTRPSWGEGQCLCIMGDVWFTDETMDIMTSREGMHWYGRRDQSPLTGGPPEVFAIGWHRVDEPRLVNALEAGIAHAKQALGERDAAGSPIGSVWQPYRWLENIPLEMHRVNNSGLFVECPGWTDDFDTYERFQNWKLRYGRRWIGDKQRAA